MEKKNKIALANGLIWLHQRLFSSLRPTSALSTASEFSCIAIYSTTALGDLMFNTPSIRQLRLRYPRAKLILIAHRKYSAMLQGYEDVDEVVCWDGKFSHVFGLIRILRRFPVDLAVILHSRAPYDVLSAVFSGCNTIVRDDKHRNGEIPLARWLSAASESNFVGHEIQRRLNLLAALGCHPDQIEMRLPCHINRQHYVQPGKVRVGFQLGTSKAERCWPVASFVDLAQRLLADRPDVQIVLMGITSEQVLEQAFFSQLDPVLKPRVVSLVGKTSIQEVFDVIASLDLLVTGDTGPLHLAAALKVKTVGLFVVSDPKRTGTYQDPELHTVIFHPLNAECSIEQRQTPMSMITPDEVFFHARQALPLPLAQ